LLPEVANSQVRLFAQAEYRTFVVYLQGKKREITQRKKERKKKERKNEMRIFHGNVP
jgi:hypothetical protein